MLPIFYTTEMVLELTDATKLVPENFDRVMSSEEIMHIVQLCGCLWKHSGDPQTPHALFTGGKHSTQYINCPLMLSYTNLCRLFAQQMKRAIDAQYEGPIDWVVGSSTAAADLSKDMANLVGARHHVFEKTEDGRQVWKGPKIGEGEVILQIEDLVTSAKSARAVRAGLQAAHEYTLQYVPFVGVLIHESDLEDIDGTPVVYLAHCDNYAVEPDACELCHKGSTAIPPKANWAQLTGRT